MGYLQDTIWNNAFYYAYPISFLGAICYGLLAVAQMDPAKIISNPNLLLAINIFVGLAGLLALGAWFKTDLSFADPVTGLVDLKLNTTITKGIAKS